MSSSSPENIELYNELLYGGSNTASMAQKIAESRAARLELTWQILTRTWDEHLVKPTRLPKRIWLSLVPRFKATDLATPVLETIVNASHGCEITRRIKSAHNKEELEDFMKRANYAEFIRACATQTTGYGTAYPIPGWRMDTDEPSLTLGPSVTTFIDTPEDDVHQIDAIEMRWETRKKKYTDAGIYVADKDSDEWRLLDRTNFGFNPVSIWRGRHLDPSSPYGEGYIWPAVEESKQVTFIDCDLMVLAKTQSFGVLVTQGMPDDTKEMEAIGPFSQLRFLMDRQTGNVGNARFIAPGGKIETIDKLIESKYERTAVQCRVPVSIFTRERSGTNQGTGATHMQHQPLYDLVVNIQEADRIFETDLLARIDAMISWRKAKATPQNLTEHKRQLDVEITYAREVTPEISQQEWQTWEGLVDSSFVEFERAYWRFNKHRGTKEEMEKLRKQRESRARLELANNRAAEAQASAAEV